jgi:cobalt/nickel transport protein
MVLAMGWGTASAHFGAVLPSDDMVFQEEENRLEIQVKFIHPMEMHYMEMARPQRFGVVHGETTLDLSETLQPAQGKGPDQARTFTYWTAPYTVRRPGDHTFFAVPEPYWEPAEDAFIVHYTKVCVHAFGLEQGWDRPVGLETEIVPLTRPYGLWTGNLFTGQVLLQGQPVPFAEVEVEYLNGSGGGPALGPPDGPYVTQVVKADAGGVFSYAMPRAGWWGFAALSEAGWTIQREGQEKAVEVGAVYWVRTRDMD